mmetsp:Transcript_18491/g.37728  ORF Transcript_18491/g.37728 Transcript_18491/m.37728 type:complete len:96 (-) Transcript_18491:536-823(-)|eukprot:CAMPEP_0113821908 /NCGR_PEP_ID=MMETSP0328-20130328/1975_1 /TAXON_ID=39455 /ORGANISM="Alexandrium minutum" /LENGTH=95 /DNA_ID=CAMNT_0000789843 /DNA_START=161 /DNA_END=448 /DNA_ORIENTATION=- /assembly_acc=CAM_ASM_000350
MAIAKLREFSFGGRQLEDGGALSDYVQKEITLLFVLRSYGGMRQLFMGIMCEPGVEDVEGFPPDQRRHINMGNQLGDSSYPSDYIIQKEDQESSN